MSVGNNSASDVQEILEFLSCLVAGDFSKNLSRPQDQIILGQIVEKLNELGQKLAAQAQAQAHAEKDLFSALISCMSDEVWVADSAKKFTLANPSALKQFGLNSLTALDIEKYAASLEVLRPDGSPRPIEEAPTLRALQGEIVTDLEEIIRNPDTGELRYRQVSANPLRDAAGHIIGSVSVVRDITERKRVEAELERARTILVEAQRIAHLGSFEYVAPTQTTFWSEEEYRIYGLDPAGGSSPAYDVMLKKCIHPDDMTLLHNTFTTAMQSKSVYELEHRIVRPDGSSRWVYDRAQPYFDRQGELLRYIGITLDITERKNAEMILQDAKEAAEKANRTKDLFLATLSHELRTPLTAILSWAQLLKSGRLDPSQVGKGLQTIEEAALAQNQLISDLLDISRIASGKVAMDIQEVELTEIVSGAVKMVHISAEKKDIQVIERLGSLPIFVQGDPGRLKQVVWNLLTNSIKFTPAGGKVEVLLDVVDVGPEPRARIMVRDTGKGLSPDFLPHIFEQFSQADSSSARVHGGLGLGLALAHGLVKLHGGTIEVQSAGEGKGSTFIIVLPVSSKSRFSSTFSEAHTTGVASSGERIGQVSLSGVRILLVDDDPTTLSSIQEMLSFFGAKVNTALSVRDALASFEKSTPDVMISDIAMPNEDGYCLIQKIRNLSHDQGGITPAVALTAYADAQTRQKALAAGFQTHIAKPVDSDELVRAILKARRASSSG